MAVRREAAPLSERPVEAVMRELAIKECLKGIFGIPVAIAGGFLMAWSSKWSGFAYWSGTIAGLVIFCIALAYVVVFFKLLIRGDATKVVAAAIKGGAMKEWMKVFLAFASIGTGTCFILRAYELTYYLAEWMPYCIGIILIAGGITYFWTRSKFYKG